MLFLVLLAIPLIGVLALLLMRDKLKQIPLVTSLATLIFAISFLKEALIGKNLAYNIDLVGPFQLTFQADALSTIFVFLTAFLWLIVSIYSPKYMEHETNAFIFQLCTLTSLFTVLGVFTAGNLLTMLLFFELMSISTYFWVIHRRNKESFKAGYFYLFFSIVGGLLLALAMAIIYIAVGALPEIASGLVSPLYPKLFGWGIFVLILAFGIKAGMVPLHLWLPHAHSVAPTPASALLSGLIIKIGAYGLIRTGEFVGWGVNLAINMKWLSTLLIILASATMLLGVLAALIQSDAKKLLAYHSISQMGYILLGLAVGLYLGPAGGIGLSGAIYHIINHALFKTALFLGVGIIYLHTGTTNLYDLGGLRRNYPITAILMLFAVLAITGAPGLNGYVSKTLLHDGIHMAAEIGDSWLSFINILFSIVGVGTAASFSKLYYLIFLRKNDTIKTKEFKSTSLKFSLALLTTVMLLIGLKPKLLLNSSIIAASQNLGIANISSSLNDILFFSVKDITSMLVTLALGVAVCWAGLKTGAFHIQLPAWLTIEGIVKISASKLLKLWQAILQVYLVIAGKLKNAFHNNFKQISTAMEKFDKSKAITIYGVELGGLSADTAILIITLLSLLAYYGIMAY